MRRTRRFILLLIALIVAGVGITYRLQKVMQTRQAPARPDSLPESVSARADNWSWEKTLDGKPVVRVWAGDFKQNTEKGKIELQTVELHLFHKDAASYDRVKSAKADFSMGEGILFSDGDVEITMGLPAAPETKPAGRLLVIRTSGARFDTATGKATTDRAASFQFERSEGQCTGAQYDPATRELQMYKDVHLVWRGDKPKARPMEVQAGSLLYKEAESKIFLNPWSKFKRDTLTMDGGAAIVTLKEGVIDNVEAQTAKGIDTRPKRQVEYAADHLNIRFDENGVLQNVVGEPNAKLLSTTATARTQVDAGRIDLDFITENEESELRKALASSGAVVESTPIPRTGVPTPDTRVLRSAIVALYMRPGGEEIDRVDTEAPGVIEFRPNRPGQKLRTVNGEHMKIEYAAANQIKSFQAVNVTTRTEPEPVKGKPQPPALTSSKGLNADFDPKTGVMTRLEQWDDFKYEEGDRRAVAQRAELRNPTEEVYLTGAARVWDKSGSTSGDTIRISQKSADVEATGKVSSTRLPEKKKEAAPGLLSGDEPVQARSAKMTATDNNMVILYEGDALVWQGPNRIQADRVRIDRRSGRLDAWGNVRSQLLEKANAAKKKDQVFTTVRAPELNYDDKQRLAHYKGGSLLNRGTLVVTAREIRAFLKSGDDSSLDHAYADGNSKVVQTRPGRTLTGTSEHTEYYADTGKVVLTGGQPRFVDSLKGTTQGRQITYYPNDDHFVVEGEQTKPVQSKIPRKSE